MAKDIIMPPQDVEEFLITTREVLEHDEDWQINMQEWAGKINKTRNFMAEKGLRRKDIKQVVVQLSVENYCYTRDDTNDKFPNEQFWFFGIKQTIIDEDIDLYIKLKIRRIAGETLLVMSFHPECPERQEDKLQFPYKKVKT